MHVVMYQNFVIELFQDPDPQTGPDSGMWEEMAKAVLFISENPELSYLVSRIDKAVYHEAARQGYIDETEE